MNKIIYEITFSDGKKTSYDLSEVITISQKNTGEIKLYFKNGFVAEESGKWDQAAIDHLYDHFYNQKQGKH